MLTRVLLRWRLTVQWRTVTALVSLGVAVLAPGPRAVSRPVSVADWRVRIAGPLLSTVSVGPRPYDLVVDARRSHVFVVNGGGSSGSASVSMLDAMTGRRLRTVPVGFASGPVGVDSRAGRVLVLRPGGSRGSVAVLDAVSGRLLNTMTIGVVGNLLALAVDERTGRVFVANGGGGVIMLNSATGHVLHTTRDVSAPLALDGWTGRVFVSGPAYDSVGLLDAGTGRLVHTIPIDGNPCSIAVDSRAGRAVVAVDRSNPQEPGQQRDAEEVLMLDTHNGRVQHSAVLDEWAPLSCEVPSVAVDPMRGRAAVVVCPDPQSLQVGACLVAILDTRSGRVLHGVRVGKLVAPGTANIPPSSVYAGSVAMDARRGLTFVATLGGSTRQAPSTVVALDTGTGRVRAQIRVGRAAVALAVDEQRGRLFVANEDDGTVSVIDTTRL